MKTAICTVITAIFLIPTLSIHLSLAATIHIPGDQPSIQDGIWAASDGDLVLVAPGTYIENIDFLGKAITVESEAGTGMTIIDGSQAGSVVTFNSGESEDAVLDGFTIWNGSGTYYYDIITCGGGIYCSNASPAIMNCAISENTAHSGGGIYCEYSHPWITNCTISENIASFGGAINCQVSSPTVTNCTITGNTASYAGGGIFKCYVYGPPTMTITNCILWGDSAPAYPEIRMYWEGAVVVTYSDVQGGWPGQGNIDADPLFAGEGDFHLGPGSPCIDTGAPKPIYNDKCFPPSKRTGFNDMGAYGGPGACGASRFTLEVDASYMVDLLSLDFTIGTPETAVWANYLIVSFPTVQYIPLWTLSLPAIDPPIDITIEFPLSSMGWIGICTGLLKSGFRIEEFAWVETK